MGATLCVRATRLIQSLKDIISRGYKRLHLRLNLQAKILLLVAASMLLILFTSSYLHTVRTRAVIANNHYESAISQITVLSDRISRYGYFNSLEDLQQETQLVAGSRPDFKQIKRLPKFCRRAAAFDDNLSRRFAFVLLKHGQQEQQRTTEHPGTFR